MPVQKKIKFNLRERVPALRPEYSFSNRLYEWCARFTSQLFKVVCFECAEKGPIYTKI